MGNEIQLRAMRLSTVGVLTLMVAACGSSGGSDNAAPTTSQSSNVAAQSSTAAAQSSLSSSSSSSADSGSGFAISCDPNGSYIECLDFEAMAPGAVPAGFNLSGSGVAVVEGEGAFSGDLALKVTAVQGGSFFEAADVTGSHWGRIYYKNVSRPSTVGTWSHTTLIGAYDNATQTHFRLVDMVAAPDSNNNAGKYQHLYNIDNPSQIDLSLEGDYVHTYGNDWVCLEWQVDAVNQQYHVYFNGDELTLKNAGTASNETDLQDAKKYNGDTHDFVPVPATFDVFKIGIQNYQGHDYTFLLDDIAIADTRVGCDIAIAVESSSSSDAASSMAAVAGKVEYEAMCEGCHDGSGSGSGPNLSGTSLSGAALVTKIDSSMPKGSATDCQGQCATDVANYIETVIKN